MFNLEQFQTPTTFNEKNRINPQNKIVNIVCVGPNTPPAGLFKWERSRFGKARCVIKRSNSPRSDDNDERILTYF